MRESGRVLWKQPILFMQTSQIKDAGISYNKSKEKGTDYKCLGDLWHHRVRGRNLGDRAGAQPEEHHGEHRVQLQLLRAHHVPGREPRRGKEEAAKKIDNSIIGTSFICVKIKVYPSPNELLITLFCNVSSINIFKTEQKLKIH